MRRSVFVMLCCLVMFIAWLIANPVQREFPNAGPDARDAVSAAQDIVLQSLRAPSTAKFVRGECGAEKLADGSWVAVVTVDAQNAFGAMLRERYRVPMRYVAERGTFQGRAEEMAR